MNEQEIQTGTFIQKVVADMWRDFVGSHEKLVAESVKQMSQKGTIVLSEQAVERVWPKVLGKLSPITEDMSEHFSEYRKQVTSRVGALIKAELKQIIDVRMGELGFDADEGDADLLEPVSKLQEVTDKLK